MIHRPRLLLRKASGFAAAALVFAALLWAAPAALAQKPASPPTSSASSNSSTSSQSSSSDRWLHIRVDSPESKGETVRVNVPIELAEKVLPAINHDRLHGGKVKICNSEVNGVDLRALLDAVRSSKDGEYVTVQGNDQDVRVAKQGGQLLVNVNEKRGDKKAHVEIRVPLKVVDALLSAGKDELDLVAAFHVLAAQGDTELVSVKDSDNTVRIWLDSKNESN